MRPTLVAIDPGESTGLAIFFENGDVLTNTVSHEELENALRPLIPLHPDRVVVELLPHKLSPLMRQIESICLSAFPYTTRVAPSVWKTVNGKDVTTPKTRLNGERTTIHEKDAYRMGRYVLRFQHNA